MAELPSEVKDRMGRTEIMVEDVVQETTSGTDGPRSSGRPQDALLCEMALPLQGTFYPLGYPVEIITNDAAVLESAQESFGHGRLSRTCETLQIRVGVSLGDAPDCPPEPTRREYNH